MQLADLTGKRVVIWGAGREAGAVVHAVAREGIDVRLSIVDEAPDGPESVDGVAVIRGAEAVDALAAADVIVRSPGVSPYRPDNVRLLAAVPAHTTATRLFMAGDHAPVLAVTGTKGKSTTASLIAHVLQALGVDARLAGNIGRSPLDHHGDPEPDWWVLELSSYQTSDLDRSPEVGVLTSLSPEHLDWHGGYDDYVKDKLNLFAHGCRRVVVNDAEAGAAEVRSRIPAETVTTSAARLAHEIVDDATMRLLGRHNRMLAVTALVAIEATGIDLEARRGEIASALSDFAPLEHRLQPVADLNGVMWVDDGLSTTPVATQAALEAFSDRHATVLVGGHDRGLEYRGFAEYVAANADRLTVIAMPDSGERIAAAIRGRRPDDADLVLSVDDLEEAVRTAARVTPPGGVVLLSPAAPSFGRFMSYVERSAAFVEAVRQLD